MTQEKNEKHVLGMHATVCELLALAGKVSDRQLKEFIFRRACKYIKKYMVLSERAGVAQDKKMLVSAIVTLRHPKIIAYVVYFSINWRARQHIKEFFKLGSGTSSQVR